MSQVSITPYKTYHSDPAKPSQSSATRKIDRIRMASVARRTPTRKILKTMLRRVRCFSGSMSKTPLWQRQLKSAKKRMKVARLTACRSKPAIMMSIPTLERLWVLAVSAIAPPIACKRSERKSEVMKAIAMVRGAKRELCVPYRTMILVMQR